MQLERGRANEVGLSGTHLGGGCDARDRVLATLVKVEGGGGDGRIPAGECLRSGAGPKAAVFSPFFRELEPVGSNSPERGVWGESGRDRGYHK